MVSPRIRNPGKKLKVSKEIPLKKYKIPGKKILFRAGYSFGTLLDDYQENKDVLRKKLKEEIRSGVYEDSPEDEEDFSAFEIRSEILLEDEEFSIENLQLSQISNSSSLSGLNPFTGSIVSSSILLPLLATANGEAHSPKELHPELEYEYEPGISLSQFEFAQDEALLVGNPFIDYEADLQLAAELGKTLLERNKELENVVKQHQSMIEDQSHEIEYLTKQNLALREVNESRLKVYEQLEVSINDLEDLNRKLMDENKSDKNRIKSLTLSNDRLEGRIEELQRCVEESRDKQQIQTISRTKRRERRRSSKSESDSSSSSSKIPTSLPRKPVEQFWGKDGDSQSNGDGGESGDDESERMEEFEDDDDDDNALLSSTKDSSLSGASSRLGTNSPVSSGYASGEPCRFSTSSVSDTEAKFESAALPKEGEVGNRLPSTPEEFLTPEMAERKISELQKAFANLDNENAVLKREIENSKMQEDTVQDEVLKIHEVKIGKLCRKCLGNIENPLAVGANAVQQIVQQVQNDFIQESPQKDNEKVNVEIPQDLSKSEDSSSSSSYSTSPIPHFPPPHKYSPPIHRNSSPSISLQDELIMSFNNGRLEDSGFSSLSCRSSITLSPEDNYFSSSTPISDRFFARSRKNSARRKESGSSSPRKDSFTSNLLRRDSSLSTWSSPEYDIILSEINGETPIVWSGPTSILLPEYAIPEEKAEDFVRPSSAVLESSSEDNCSSGFFDSLPLAGGGSKLFINKHSQTDVFVDQMHQNYKEIFKEIFAVLRKAEY